MMMIWTEFWILLHDILKNFNIQIMSCVTPYLRTKCSKCNLLESNILLVLNALRHTWVQNVKWDVLPNSVSARFSVLSYRVFADIKILCYFYILIKPMHDETWQSASFVHMRCNKKRDILLVTSVEIQFFI